MKDFAFPRRLRIARKKEYETILRRGLRLADDSITLYADRNGLGYPRLGLVVSRRFGTAVERNLFKRRTREAFRLNRAELPAGIDIIVMPARGAKEIGFEAVVDSLVKLARKAAERLSG